jgi:hypothetical protein
VAGSLSHTTMFTLTVNAPPPPGFDFSLANGGNKSVVQGQSVSNTITATLASGTSQSVTFSASGMPSGATASFSAASCNPTCTSTLTLTTSTSTPTGTSTITVTGVAGSLSHTTTFTLTVNASSQAAAKWTGSGKIAVAGGYAYFGFKVIRDTTGALSGRLSFSNSAAGFAFYSTNIQTLSVTGNQAVFTGTGSESVNGGPWSSPYNFTVTVQDVEPTGDTFKIDISDPSATSAGSTTTPIARGSIEQYY